MAIQALDEGSVDNGPAGKVTVSILYDDQTLLITAVRYANTTARNASVSYGGHTFTLAAGTPLATADVSALGQHVVMTTGVHGNVYAALPGGECDVLWPAP